MDRSEVISLISITTSQNEYGVTQKVKQCKEVFCDVASVGSAEFFRASQMNLDAQFRFTMFRYDYNGERLVKYDGNEYAVYRTHMPRNTDVIELYVERKAGTDGTQ